MKREFVCIVCPSSCIIYTNDTNGTLDVSGNKCEKGHVFAEKEINDPERLVTTTVKLTTGGLLPVRSRSMVKKKEVKPLVLQLKSVVVLPPVSIGQVILAKQGVNSVDIIASDNIESN